MSNNRNILQVTNLSDLKTIVASSMTVIAGFTIKSTPNELKIFIRKFLKRTSESFPYITFVYMDVHESDRGTLSLLKGDDDTYPKVIHIRDGNTILVSVEGAMPQDILDSFNVVKKVYIKEMNDIKEAQSKSKTQSQSKSNTKSNTKSKTGNNNDNRTKSNEESLLSTPERGNLRSNGSTAVIESNRRQVSTSEENDNDNHNNHNNHNNQNIRQKQENQGHSIQEITPEMAKKINMEKIMMLNKVSDKFKIDMIKTIAKRKKIEAIEEKKQSEEKKKNEDGKEYRKKLRKK